MKFRRLGVFALALSLGLASIAGWAADKGPSLSNKWRIECDDSAKSAGTISFRITRDGTPTEIAVDIPQGTGENAVAKAIKDKMKASLDAKVYHVEIDDGEDVLVKKKKGSNFALELTGNTVEGTKIKIEKE